MNVIIYAAGRGTRLGGLTEIIPKALLIVAGKPLIEYALARAARFNPKLIIIVVGYQADAVKRVVGDSYQGVFIRYVFNGQYMCAGNMTSLWAAREFCKEDTMLTTSDMICVRSDVDCIADAPAQNKILIDRSPQHFNDPEPVKVALKERRVIEVRKRDFTGDVGGVAIGVYCFGALAMSELIVLIGERVRVGTVNASLYYAINDVCRSQKITPIYTESDNWFDIDTPEELIRADRQVSTHKASY
ncbi:MAG: NTP transferase domain-containing protein [bacterium]|nr:NTP transferase domain-containing protein [bacterium]